MGSIVRINVSLDCQPIHRVTVPIALSDPLIATAESVLVFGPENWGPQTLNVTGLNSGILEADTSYSVIIGPANSEDTRYEGQTRGLRVNHVVDVPSLCKTTATSNYYCKRRLLSSDSPVLFPSIPMNLLYTILCFWSLLIRPEVVF